MIDRIDRTITLRRQARRRDAQAADGDRRQVPGAPDADLGDRYPHRRSGRRNSISAFRDDREAAEPANPYSRSAGVNWIPGLLSLRWNARKLAASLKRMRPKVFISAAMQTAAHALTQQFLAWVAEGERSYADAEAWRRSCPHLVHLGRRHRRRAGALRERGQHAAIATRAHRARAGAARPGLNPQAVAPSPSGPPPSLAA